MQILVGTLLSSVKKLGGIAGLAFFFFSIFAILGINQMSGVVHNRCRLTPEPVDGDWELVPGDDRLCGYR